MKDEPLYDEDCYNFLRHSNRTTLFDPTKVKPRFDSTNVLPKGWNLANPVMYRHFPFSIDGLPLPKSATSYYKKCTTRKRTHMLVMAWLVSVSSLPN
ncbi:MAG: hypothetical protein AAGA62_09000, partial [Bacteroidota bacterium]